MKNRNQYHIFHPGLRTGFCLNILLALLLFAYLGFSPALSAQNSLPPRGASGVVTTQPSTAEADEKASQKLSEDSAPDKGQTAPAQDAPAQQPIFLSVSAREFQRLLRINRSAVYLIDVREDYEFAASHIPGAINLPLSRLSVSLAEKYSDKPVLLYCRSGVRSLQAYRRYFSQVPGAARAAVIYQLQQGLQGWQKIDGELE